ncbi:hypothetical protein KIN20_000191 [Parelaphostrongylus tenuis]|uniref:Uncharacterized protein n=1 Tax=Parelaphostrongylus tenuis TaxID=148309 RepID=A0AAD5LS40_PARTN|nr:hypothetical protein KIN20_000191 [Parelaphostrongylus tenuis]
MGISFLLCKVPGGEGGSDEAGEAAETYISHWRAGNLKRSENIFEKTIIVVQRVARYHDRGRAEFITSTTSFHLCDFTRYQRYFAS